MIRKFSEINKDHIPVVGGKGANLGEMFNNQFNVPNGFVVTTNAYFDFIKKNKLHEKIHSKLRNLDVEDTEKLDKVSAEIRLLIGKAEFQKELIGQIKTFLKEHDAEQFAVRSSATAEDLPGASFAGQQDTYLEILKKDVIPHIQRCFASLFTSRAIYYRQNKDFKHEDVGIAVVIQEMVPAEYAGVMFTIDPIRKKNILIEVASGLGEKVVSGMVTPNNYFVNRHTFEIEEFHEEEPFEQERVKEIAKLGMKIEQHYGHPMDIEFAWYKGRVYLLQARPITTL